MTLDTMEVEDDEHDTLFTKYSIETVYSSYVAATNRVRQYSKFVELLKRDEAAWKQRAERACCLLPDYKPKGWLPWD
jgi:hypothetical protein